MIIGVCGTLASGKDTVADYVASTGYTHVSTGDLIRSYIKDNDLGEIDRDNLRKVGNKLRAEKGAGYLVELAVKQHPDKLVVSGLRTIGEVDALFKAGGHLIGVDAPIERRYEWAKYRERIGDEVSFEYFREQELIENSHTSNHEQRINDVMSMANIVISNDGTMVELEAKVDDALARFKEGEQ
jgi:dephospho-CoA kinase